VRALSDRDLRARSLLLLGAALFSTGGAAIKATAYDGFQVACLRSGIAALVLWLAVPEARKGYGPRTLLVALAFGATLVLFVLATKSTAAVNAILLQSAAPLYLLLLAPLVLRERVTARDLGFLAAVALGLLICMLDLPAATAKAPHPALGNTLGAASGLTWALTLLGLRWAGSARGGGNNVACVVAGNALACLLCLPFALPFAAPSGGDALALLWLGVFQIGAAYLCVTAGLRRVPAFEASLLLLAEPVLNPVWAWLVHGERPGPFALVGGVLILGASAASAWSARRARAAAAA
jgi:drug/metabolite transporter (DMT)-like permease